MQHSFLPQHMVSSLSLCHVLFQELLDLYLTELMEYGSMILIYIFLRIYLLQYFCVKLSMIFVYYTRVSGDRLLMRQPTLRLGVLIYWIALHALLASFI